MKTDFQKHSSLNRILVRRKIFLNCTKDIGYVCLCASIDAKYNLAIIKCHEVWNGNLSVPIFIPYTSTFKEIITGTFSSHRREKGIPS